MCKRNDKIHILQFQMIKWNIYNLSFICIYYCDLLIWDYAISMIYNAYIGGRCMTSL